jgi:hypothetical protein
VIEDAKRDFVTSHPPPHFSVRWVLSVSFAARLRQGYDGQAAGSDPLVASGIITHNSNQEAGPQGPASFLWGSAGGPPASFRILRKVFPDGDASRVAP